MRLARSKPQALYLVAAVLLLLCLVQARPSHANPSTPIFVLHSYSQEYPWTKRQHEGFLRKLGITAPGMISPSVEYLDTKRVAYTAAYADFFAASIARKYADFEPRLIYVTDDNALRFALAHLTRIFPEAPIFFSGVNDLGMKHRIDPSRVSGVYEEKEIAPNLALMRQLAPGEHDILVVGDESNTFGAIRREIVAELAREPDIRAHFVSSGRIEQLVAALQGRKEKFVFLTTLGAMKDAAGRVLTLPETIAAIAEAGRFIIISMEDAYLYPGVLGGYVTSGNKQGAAAAGLGARYLAGTAVADIKPIDASPNEYLIDAGELGKLGLTLPSALAGRTTIVNTVPTFYERNLEHIVSMLYVLALLFGVSLTVFAIALFRKNRQIARTSEDLSRFKNALDQTLDCVFIFRLEDFRFIYVNQGAQQQVGYTKAELLAMTPADIKPEYPLERFRQLVQPLLDGTQGSIHFETMHRHKDGHEIPVEIVMQLVLQAGQERRFIAVVRDITRRRRAAHALKSSEDKFRKAFYLSPDSVNINRLEDGMYVSINRGFTQITGYTEEEILGHTSTEFNIWVNPEDRTRLVEELRKDGAVTNFEARFRTKGGDIIDGLMSASVIDIEGVPHLINITRDITERKRAEAIIAESERLLRESQSIASLGSYVLDIPTGSWKSSDELDRLFGIDEAYERKVEGWAALIHPGDRDRMLNYFNDEVLGQGRAFDATYRIIRHNDGTERWVRGLGRLELDAQKRPLAMHGSIQDITELKLAAEALRESEERFRSLTVMSSDWYWEQDANFRFTIMSGGVMNKGNFAVKNALGKTRWELPIELGESEWADHKATLEAHRAFTDFEYKIITDDGSAHYYSASGQPFFDSQGTFKGYRGVANDITERKKAAEALRVGATAFESQEGMVITDAAQVILRVNRAFTEITGYSAEEVAGKTPSLLRSGRHDANFYAAMWESIVSTGSWQGEIWNRRKNGEVYPQWLSITAVTDERGRATNYVAAFSDITSRKAAEDEIQNLAFYDPLTKLPNRRLLLDRLEQALASSSRSKRSGALLFIDLDNFKNLNDTLGHNIGDLLLQQVSERLVSCIREGDTVARLGGDEFVVMLKDLSENPQEAATQAETVGEKILAGLNQIYRLASYPHQGTASIGITLFGDHQGTLDDLLKQADLAMYQAKAAGRNTLRFFEEKMQAAIATRAAMETGLREALSKGQLLLHYQAQMVRDRLAGVEVLVRWRHPQRGLIPPIEFIPLAEETGLILPLGQWVLETACAQLAVWADRPEMAHLTIAVNVSARQFHHRDFIDQVSAALEHAGANPERLKLELTESLMLHNVEDVIAKMTALKGRGVSFSMDDFGTGYSSLSYLKRLPLDQLKIDQGFVRDILTDSNDAAIAKMIVALAESMGLMAIAEGVEIEAQKDFLANIGCHAYQGYLFGRPLPLQEFEALAKQV